MTNSEYLLLLDEIQRLKNVLGITIGWIAQSAGSPLSIKDAEALIKMLTEKD